MFLKDKVDLRKMFDLGVYERNRPAKNGETFKSSKAQAKREAKKKMIAEKYGPKKTPVASPWPMADAAKKITFQLVQTLALLWGWDLSTKEADIPPLAIFQDLVPVMNRRIDFTDRSDEGIQKSHQTLNLIENMKQVTFYVILKLILEYPVIGLMKLGPYNVSRRTMTILVDGEGGDKKLEELPIPWIKLPFGISVADYHELQRSALFDSCKVSQVCIAETYCRFCEQCGHLFRLLDAPLSLNYRHVLCNGCNECTK